MVSDSRCWGEQLVASWNCRREKVMLQMKGAFRLHVQPVNQANRQAGRQHAGKSRLFWGDVRQD